MSKTTKFFKKFSNVVNLQLFAGLISSLWRKCILPGSPKHLPLLEHVVNDLVDGNVILYTMSRQSKTLPNMSGAYHRPGEIHTCIMLLTHKNTKCSNSPFYRKGK